MVLSGGSHGMFLTVNFAFGFAATLGILVSGQISGEGGTLLSESSESIGSHQLPIVTDTLYLR